MCAMRKRFLQRKNNAETEKEVTPLLRIRNETQADYPVVEDLTRRAFYNVYVPGCVEHYLVHTMRAHADFVPELDFVLELDGRIIGNVMYTKARLTDENGAEKTILTFGPVSILPEYQRKGYGKTLLEHSFGRAIELCYDAIVIFGDPANYVSCGFRSCKKYNVSLDGGHYPTAMLVKELRAGALDGHRWTYRESPAMEIDEAAARAYDDTLAPMEKKWMPSQEAFYILSHSSVVR